jgi:hypothetical protein
MCLWSLTNFFAIFLVFFIKPKDEAFTHARDLILWLQNEFPKNAIGAICSDNGTKFKNTHFETFMLPWDSSISSPLHMCLSRMALLNTRIRPLFRWSGRCLMSIGLLGTFVLKRSTLLAMCQTTYFLELS